MEAKFLSIFEPATKLTKFLRKLIKLNQNKLQILVETKKTSVFENEHITVIRFWKTLNDTWKMGMVDRNFIKTCMTHSWPLDELLSHNVIAVLEGMSDSNILREWIYILYDLEQDSTTQEAI